MSTAPHLAPVPDEPEIPIEATLEEEAMRYAGLLDQYERIGAELNRIKARFRDELATGKAHEVAGLKVQVSQPMAFSAAKAAAVLSLEELNSITDETTWVSPTLAAQVLTAEQLAAISESKREISAQLAKAKLAKNAYQSCCEPSGTKRVTVK